MNKTEVVVKSVVEEFLGNCVSPEITNIKPIHGRSGYVTVEVKDANGTEMEGVINVRSKNVAIWTDAGNLATTETGWKADGMSVNAEFS